MVSVVCIQMADQFFYLIWCYFYRKYLTGYFNFHSGNSYFKITYFMFTKKGLATYMRNFITFKLTFHKPFYFKN